MNWLTHGLLTKYAPRLLGALAALIVGKAAQKGLTLDPAEVTTGMIAVYALGHRLVSKKLNPGDATKDVLIQQDKDIVENAK